MFRLTAVETEGLRFQFGISKVGRGGRQYRPYAFREQGVAMLSTVLRSERAVAVNILMREVDLHGTVLADVLKALRALERPTSQKRREIGLRPKG